MPDVRPQDGGVHAHSSRIGLTIRSVVVTGGDAAIGWAITLPLPKYCARLAIFDRITERIDEVFAKIEAYGETASDPAIDITGEKVIDGYHRGRD